MDIPEDIICPECGGIMLRDSNPDLMRCTSCGHVMPVDDVKGFEENPVGIEE